VPDVPISGETEAKHAPLGERLSVFFGYGFFRPLARPSAAVYVDCADRLEAASDEGGQLSPSDALTVIRELDFPFAGIVRVPSEPMIKTLAHLAKDTS
jgi:hypothetical protein